MDTDGHGWEERGLSSVSLRPSVFKRIKNHGWTQMNTDERPDIRRTAESKLLFRAETERISGNGIVLRPSYPCPSVSIRGSNRLRLRRVGSIRGSYSLLF